MGELLRTLSPGGSISVNPEDTVPISQVREEA